MAQEIQVGENRYLVAANMGIGREHLNRSMSDAVCHMSDILAIAGDKVSRLSQRHSEATYLTSRGQSSDNTYLKWEVEDAGYLGNAIEALTAAAIDIAFLRGGMPLVEKIINKGK